jgi:hypothetical protein
MTKDFTKTISCSKNALILKDSPTAMHNLINFPGEGPITLFEGRGGIEKARRRGEGREGD